MVKNYFFCHVGRGGGFLERTPPFLYLIFPILFCVFVFSFSVCEKIDKDAEDEGACDGCDRYLTDGERETADTCDEYR